MGANELIEERIRNKIKLIQRIGLLAFLTIGIFLIFIGLAHFTYEDPCDKICSPGVNVRPAQGICICATTIEIREKK